MSDRRAHIIGRQVVEVRLSDQGQPYAVQQAVSEIVQARFTPVLERVLDAFAPAGEVVSLDRLEVDLEVTSLEDLDSALEVRLEEALKRALAGLPVRSGEPVSVNLSWSFPERIVSDGIEPDGVHLVRQWIEYLVTGYVRWPARESVLLGRESEIVQALTSRAEARELLRPVLVQHSGSRQRLADRLDEAWLSELVSLLAVRTGLDTSLNVAGLLQAVRATLAGENASLPRSFQTIFWENLLLLSAEKHRGVSLSDLTGEALFRAAHSDILPETLHDTLIRALRLVSLQNSEWRHAILVVLARSLRKRPPSVHRPSAQDQPGKSIEGRAEALAEALAHSPDTEPESEQARGSCAVSTAQREAIHEQPGFSPDGVRPAERRTNLESVSSGVYEGSEVHVWNAGLVLLQPFLTTHFERLRLLREKEFLSDESCFRAIYQLHYLASGETTAPEYMLVLNKLLCGLPLDTVVPYNEVRPEDASEGDDLLRAVVSYWDALKNTSADGLREAFIQRDATLTHGADGWLLRVERKTIDVLLGRLPWAISIVKLPWMPELLRVEWT